MRLKVLGCFVLLVLLAISADAAMLKGSVGAGGHKTYTFTPNGDGHVQVTLMYDNAGSDLDLAVGFIDNNGDPVLIGSGTSTLKNFERCEAGVDPNISYSVVVNSYRGASPFRIYVTTTSQETVNVTTAQAATLEESDVNQTGDKLQLELKRIQHAQRKK